MLASASKSKHTTKEKAKDKSKSKKDKSKSKKHGERRSKKSKDNTQSGSKQASLDLQIYCAIYTPHFGNYYHWAFAVYNPANNRWAIFDVVQDFEDGPFIRNELEADPRNSNRCVGTYFLGTVQPSRWTDLTNVIHNVAVPGEAATWNCQDYVMEIWEGLHHARLINEAMWRSGHQTMLGFYGPDFGGENTDDQGDYDEDEDGEGGAVEYPSAEFVVDSEDSDV